MPPTRMVIPMLPLAGSALSQHMYISTLIIIIFGARSTYDLLTLSDLIMHLRSPLGLIEAQCTDDDSD